MITRIIGLIGFLIILIGCQRKNEKVIVTQYSWDKLTIKSKSSLFLYIDKTDSLVKYHVSDSNSVTTYEFDKPICKDSVIYMYDMKMKLIDTKKYKVGNLMSEVLKFEFKDGTDGDLTLFLDKDYGPIILRSDAWGGYITYDRLNKQQRGLIEIIKNDSLKFGGV